MKAYVNKNSKLCMNNILKIILLTLFIILLSAINFGTTKSYSATDILKSYGVDYFGEEYSNGYIRDCTSADVIRTSEGINVKTGGQLSYPSANHKNILFYTSNNTSKSEYIDYSKAARYIDNDGKSVWLDMRIYIWTNNSKYPWGMMHLALSLNNGYSSNQHTYMEFHFYTEGHCGENQFEQDFRGVTKVSDLDTCEGWAVSSGYNKFYTQSGIPIVMVLPGDKNSTNNNNPFIKTGTATYPYFFGTRINSFTDNVWFEINSTVNSPLILDFGSIGARATAISYTGTPIEYYVDGVLKDTSYCVPYGKYKLINPTKMDEKKTGYTIDGWYTNTNYNVKATDGIAGDDTIKVYGRYRLNNYTVQYNGNGATSGSTANSNHTYNVAKNLTPNGFEKKNTVTFNHNYEDSKNLEKQVTYTFKNWNTKQDGTGTSYNNQAQVKNLTSNDGEIVNLYAMWDIESIKYIPTRYGYKFMGWYTDAECTNKVSNGEYKPTSDITLYAKWEDDEGIRKYTITVDNEREGHTYNSYQVFQGDYSERLDEEGTKIPTLSNIEWSEELQKEVETGKTHGDKIIELLKEKNSELYKDCQTAEDVAEKLIGNPNDGEVIREFTRVVGKYLLDNKIEITKGTSKLVEEKDVNGNVIDKNYKITDLQPGYYIVIDAKANEKDDAYSRYLIDVVQDVTMYPKSSIPTLKKKVIGNNIKNQIEGTGTSEENPSQFIEDEKRNTATYKVLSETYNATDYDIGFELRSYIPKLDEYSTYKFEIVDILAKGFDLDSNSIKVFLGESEYSEENYTITSIVISAENYETYKSYFEEEGKEYPENYKESQYGKTLILVELNDLVSQMNDKIVTQGQDVFVRYNAKLNGKGETGKIANTNEAYLKYSNNPYDSNQITQTTLQTTYTYTIDLNLNKIAQLKSATDEKKYLEGAEFEIYNKADTVEERTLITTIITNELGEALYSSLGTGTYYLKEVKAPEGYNKLREEIEIEVKATTDELGEIRWTVENVKENKLLLAQIAEKEGTTITEIKLQVENTSGFQLPVTGGSGTIIFTVVGLSIMLLVTISLKSSKKKIK